MEIEYYRFEWKVGTAPMDNEENVMIDDAYNIHCIKKHPFYVTIELPRTLIGPRLIIFSLINSLLHSQLIERCEKHTKSDRLTQLCHKALPLVIHEDLSSDYPYRYAENGSVAIILPPQQQVHGIPVAIKCSSKCTRKPFSLMVCVLNEELDVPINILPMHVYENRTELIDS
ncbi:uncharacterized protein [Chelonus insularis]|uniref:uncharacterized protein n=1 Tax=Chelonus insularis TaxID=460826 RepID=UPI00158AD987|nr:uncharacterized protein LOC118070399 [Chelonus insularis]